MSCFWCFTENLALRSWVKLPDGVTYMVWQLEKVAHLHCQGYVELAHNQRISWVRKHISDTAHWEIRAKGSSGELARHYCMKPVDGCDCKHCKKARAGNEQQSTPRELGVIREMRQGYRKGNGIRNDIIEFRDAIISGKLYSAAGQRGLYPGVTYNFLTTCCELDCRKA